MIENAGGAAGASRAISIAKALLISARPWQWYKNLVIYLAFFFTVNEAWMPGGDVRAALTLFGEITLAFAAFSALTSAVYLVNDILDAERDRLHTQKRNRPVASGRLPVSVAWTAAALAAVIGLGGSFALDPLFGVVSCAYALANAAYSLLLKHIVLVDVFVISSGMVLRAVAGAVIMQVPISPWLYLCTALVALLLALVKRRTQLASAGENAAPAARHSEPLHSGIARSAHRHNRHRVAHSLLALHLHRAQPTRQQRNDAHHSVCGIRAIPIHPIGGDVGAWRKPGAPAHRRPRVDTDAAAVARKRGCGSGYVSRIKPRFGQVLPSELSCTQIRTLSIRARRTPALNPFDRRL